MASDASLDYAVFQLSPKRSRCELFVSYDGTMEKLASGLVKPFVTHLQIVEDQVALTMETIKLEADTHKKAETWFTKGTLERFVRFVSTPEVLEMVNTFDAEMSQLEAARRIYSQGAGDHHPSPSSGGEAGANAASDATKKELLRAIDVRLAAVKQDLTTACARASAAGFNPGSVLELQHFADCFGAHRLSEACSKFVELLRGRPDLFNNTNNNLKVKSSSDQVLRSSFSSDMSIDSPVPDQHTSSTTNLTFPLRRFSREPIPSPIDVPEGKVDKKDNDIDKALGPTTNATAESEPLSQSSQTPQLTRRLSVQERINLFESKQKDNPPSIATPTSTSAGVKPELRRLSSDVASSSDKAVLRRWSGVSDMSIDVSGERKEPDSNSNTPTPTSSSSIHHVLPPKSKDQDDLKGKEVHKGEESKDPKFLARAKFGAQLAVSSGGGSGSGSGLEEHALPARNSKNASITGRSAENVALKEKSPSQSTTASFGGVGDLYSGNLAELVHTQFKAKPGKTEQLDSVYNTASQEKEKCSSGGGNRQLQDTGRDFGAPYGHQGEFDDNLVMDQSVPRSQSRSAQRRAFEVAADSAASDTPLRTIIQNRGGVDSLPEPRSRSLGEEVEKVGRKNVLETQEAISSTSLDPMDQVQRARQSKGNQGLNDELKTKANELEKLFAKHKLRVPADQSNSARKNGPAETPMEQEGISVKRKLVVEASPAQLTMEIETAADSNNMKFSSTPSVKTVNQDYDVSPKHNIYSPNVLDDCRGNFYQKYMQKRDAKIREDWGSKSAERQAKMKALQDSLEKSRAEMMTKLAGSADKRSSVLDARRQARKLSSCNVRSVMKRDQHLTNAFMSDVDEDQAEFLGKKLSETLLWDSSSRNAQTKKVLSNKSATSSISRNSTTSVTRSSGKASNSASGRRRLNSDNPLAQSVPNFSDLRKENTKPSSAGSKPVRPQGRNNARKKSSSEDLPLVNEENSRQSQSLRKSSANGVELNDSCNYDDVEEGIFMPSKHNKEEHDKFSMHMESKLFSKRDNNVGRTTVSGIGRSNALVMMEDVRNGNEFGNVSFETEEVTDAAQEDDEVIETTMGAESADMDNGKEGWSQGSDKSANYGYENSTALRFSEADPASATELPMSMPFLFRTVESIQDSPRESPGSWNSPVQNPFSFSHEISDIDASDSPLGSHASWNFHTLAQTEAEAARMRKKWGAAQKPILGTDSSHSRKDVSKGLKRFLKFGRKNRASESLADWISATTSEGDDDTEDGRDFAYRSSEDLRKSRMGFSHSHHPDDGFNESDFLNDQVNALRSSIPTSPTNFKLREEHLTGGSLKAPKSFFSLSNFRSKGSDSKPR